MEYHQPIQMQMRDLLIALLCDNLGVPGMFKK